MQGRESSSLGTRHAIVIGASMAGLLAARVLSDHFDQVTIIERDRLPDDPAFRAGVPQSRHAHILLARGRQLLEHLFPGLDADLMAAGAVEMELPGDTLWLAPAGWWQRFRPGVPVLALSRELLEWGVRSRLKISAKGVMRFEEECDVTSLLATADHRNVLGVRMRRRARGGEREMETQEQRADLVVDASGRNSPAPHWLEALGYQAPPETHVNAFLGYASRTFKAPESPDRDWKGVYLMPQPPHVTRGGVITPIEGGRWLVTLSGYGRDYPPTDEQGFQAFAHSLRSPILAEAIQRAEPLSRISGNRQSENQLRHYDRMPHQPERFLALGDAVCAFNPVYGQGMTMAAQAAMELDECLRQQQRLGPTGDALSGLAGRFQKRLGQRNAAAWMLATGEDLRYPTTEGVRPGLLTHLMHRYTARLMGVATRHATVSQGFLDVMQMLAPPATLFRPAVLIPTLLAGGQSGLAVPPFPPPFALAGDPARGTPGHRD